MPAEIPSITQCPFCGDFDSDAEIEGCVRCDLLYDRFREALPPEQNAFEAVLAFTVEKRVANGGEP